MKETLQRRIAQHWANPGERTKVELVPPVFTISGNVIEVGARIHASLSDGSVYYSLVIGVTNTQDTVCDWSELSAGLYLPQSVEPNYAPSAVQVADRYLYDLGSLGRLLPGKWKTKQITIQSVLNLIGQEFPAELVIFTPTGPVSKPFYLHLYRPR